MLATVLFILLRASLGFAAQTVFDGDSAVSGSATYLKVSESWQMLGPFQLGTRGT